MLRWGVLSIVLATLGAAPKPSIDYARARKHWAFQPLRSVDGSIDSLWRVKLAEKGIQPSPAAGKRTWLRRVTFDLTGLPPTPAEVEAFLVDRSPGAHARVVDRLLASPHYGERWARHWLDLVRFAETDGHEFDVDKPNAWRYRDWVIRAFNRDFPYDRFVEAQVAGDLAGDPEATVASGFSWLGEVINTPVDTVQALADRIDNQVDVFGKAFLGLTVACARCHDHKFDPIPTSDYYALAGFFYSSRLRQASIDPPERTAEIRRIVAQLPPRAVGQPMDPPGGDYVLFEDFAGPEFTGWKAAGEGFGPGPVNGIATTGARSDKLAGVLISRQFKIEKRYIHVRMAGGGKVRLFADDYTNSGRTLTGGPEFAWRTIDARMGQGNLAYLEIQDLTRDSFIAVDQIVFSDRKESPPAEPAPPLDFGAPSALEEQIPESEFALAAADDEPRDVRVQIRGNHSTPGDVAPRHFLSVLAGEDQAPIGLGSGRLELSRRLLESSRSLLARVMVNRIWKHHFGAGIVETVDNFGLTGDRPSNPDLLDYLAQEFIRSGWSIKTMHRLILLSEPYRQSSHAAALDADPRNTLLHHMPVRRLEAEGIRDSILAVAGTLDLTMYGPSVTPYVSPWMDGDPRGKPKSGPLNGAGRRSLYINVRRNYLTDMFLTFDYPLPITTIGRRSVSTVASQALYMMNSGFVAEQAGNWARRIERERPSDPVERMYLEAFARPPAPDEKEAARDFLSRRGLADFAHVLMNTTEFIYVR